MKYIEKIEKHSRGYYGGALGYFLLNGELNTTIIIRTAHIKNNKLSFLAGATLLHESEPADELNEIKYKSRAFLETVKNITGNYARV
ncbi:MAG: chorismate-binding protein, partial [Bacteroidetes bacterium]|nr:chorismate-binding protein [Bacteroidota bacterium]